MTLNQFIRNADFKNYSLVTVNQESPLPAQSMLEKVFDDQPITVTEQQEPSDETDTVYLVEDDEVIASSPLKAIQESILLVNSDLYITGNREVSAVDPPDVIRQLEDVRFELRGYPESNNEKLLLIIISRYIERLALESDNGRHRASFQRLSRLDDELGTKHVYKQLAESAVDTHVYGLPDWTLLLNLR
ncbi:histidine kinase [Halonotius sp. GCM10025705]|uniref:histidine kinase n=1 Tax=Halonotius sp. GCM10025705 TaxID=3252678 RepID=UPI00360D91CB